MNNFQKHLQTAFAALLAFLVGITLTLVSCKEKKAEILSSKPETFGEKIEDKVNDALDRRPNEKIRDVAEDIEKAADDVADSVKEAVEK